MWSFITQRVSGGVARGSGVGVSNAEARLKQGVGMVQSQGGVGVRPRTSPVVEEQQYIDPSILRSQLNEDEKVMMREIFDATIVPIKEAVVSTNREIKELTGAIKTLVGAAGTPDGGGGDPDDDPRRPKRVPGKDRGKPTSRKKGKHRDDDPSSSSSSSSGRAQTVQVETSVVRVSCPMVQLRLSTCSTRRRSVVSLLHRMIICILPVPIHAFLQQK